MLDERKLRTSGGALFVAPTRALADACAVEWNAQGEMVAPSRMPLTQLPFAALDHTPKRRDQLADYVAKFAETDLVCHRASTPEPLVRRQIEAWDPLVDWFAKDLDVSLQVVAGVVAAPANAQAVQTLRRHVVEFDDHHLTALAQAAGATGSAVIAMALVHGRVTAGQAYELSTIDERWSAENWGEDAEAKASLARTHADLSAIGAYLAALVRP